MGCTSSKAQMAALNDRDDEEGTHGTSCRPYFSPPKRNGPNQRAPGSGSNDTTANMRVGPYTHPDGTKPAGPPSPVVKEEGPWVKKGKVFVMEDGMGLFVEK